MANTGKKNFVNDCKKLSRDRIKLLEELNKIDNINYKKLLKTIDIITILRNLLMEKMKRNLIKEELKLSKNFYQKCTKNLEL